MPKVSTDEPTPSALARKPYEDPRTKWRTELTNAFKEKLVCRTGNSEAVMPWTIEGYAETVVCEYGLKLVGWPEKVNFADLSRVRGGSKTLKMLFEMLRDDELRFEEASKLEKLNARLDPTSVAPAKEFVHRKESGGRNDIGRVRYRWKTNPDGSKPLRRAKDGPKSDKWVVDSDDEECSRPRLR